MNSILFIAPHKEIAKIAKKVLHEMNLSIPLIIAKNLDAVNKVASSSEHSIIITRGGTARDLKNFTDKTIIDINISIIDILKSIEKLTSINCKNIAIISNNNIINKELESIKLSDISVKIYPYTNDEDVSSILEKLSLQHIDGIIGDIKPVELSKQYNIKNSIYIESDSISIKKAITEAINLYTKQQRKLLQLQTLQEIINNIDEGIIVYNPNKIPIFYNNLGRQILKNIPIFTKDIDHKKLYSYLKNYKGKILSINNEKLLLDIISLDINNEMGNQILIFQKINSVEKAVRKIRSALYQKGLYAKKTFDDILYSSEKMKTILDTAKYFAKSNSSILIYGETGTGKEGIAQSIHNASSRYDKPFVSVNCASLPPTLIESELFGYVDGAFTGARKTGKKGLFELAHTGTIFLDEIGDLPLDIQSRLLRVLQEREIMRIGDDKILPIDIRLICATNKNLKKLIAEGKFRQDLYYRINVLRITLPPLRDRIEDIPLLLDFYLNKYGNISTKNLLPEINHYLLKYPWKGNIRELKNVAEAIAFIYKKNLTLNDIKYILDEDYNDLSLNKSVLNIPINNNLKNIEKVIIQELINKNFSNDEICNLLGISRVTLWRKTK